MQFNLLFRKECIAYLDSMAPDVIVNCAAHTGVDACETDPSCWAINAEAPEWMAEWTHRNQAYLVHVSTDYVFAGNKPPPEALTEADATGPVSEYGRSKLAGEQAIAAATDRYAILRTAWLYGASGRNFLKTMLRLALKNPENPLRVVSDQLGSPTWSRTLARQIKQVIAHEAFGIFHATSEGFCSWFELAETFLSAMEVPHTVVPCSTSEYPTAAQRPANSILENTRLKENKINVFQDWQVELEQFIQRHGDALRQEFEGVL